MKRGYLLFWLLLLSTRLMVVAQAAVEGCEVAENETYFLKNIGSGLYLKFGGAWGLCAVEGHAATQVAVEQHGDGTYAIKTNAGYLGSDLVMSGPKANSSWQLVPVTDKVGQYYLKSDEGVLSSKSGTLVTQAFTPTSPMQRWVFLTEEKLKTEMEKASQEVPFDVTPLFAAASFDIQDDAASAWGLHANSIYGVADAYGAQHCAIITEAVTITKTLSGVPKKGQFYLSLSGFHRNAQTATLTVQYGNGGNKETIPFKENTEISVGEKAEALASLNSANGYEVAVQFQAKKDNLSITIGFKPRNGGGWLCLDDFRLLYYGESNNNNNEVDPSANYTSLLADYIATIQTEVDKLNEAGQAAYNIDHVLAAMNGGMIVSDETYLEAIQAIDAAYQVALEAHKQAELDDSIADGDGEVTTLIVNPSFEAGDDRGWIVSQGGVYTAATGDYAVENADGKYLLYSANGRIRQVVTGLPNGNYELEAKVTAAFGQTVYLCVNGDRVAVVAVDEQVLKDVSVVFEVTDGAADIFVVGGADDGSFTENGGCAFKADDFRLTYLGESPVELVLSETDTSVDLEEGVYHAITVRRTIKPNTWSTFVMPFDMDIPEGWSVKELTGDRLSGDNITLIFSDASSIEAGKPYMVRTDKALTEVKASYASVVTAMNHTETDNIRFVGTYTSGFVPEGAFFISSNVFYRAADETNTLKGYRAYLEVKDEAAQAKAIRFTFADAEDGSTNVDGDGVFAPSVIGIYGIDGAKRAELKKGINVVCYSNGLVRKVMRE